MSKVSVVMNCFNGEKYLREALDSVFAQTYKDWEIIFWDNCSTDKSAKIAKSYGEKVKYFKSEQTVPITVARNKAFSEARGDYVAILDVDDLWLPEKLERQIPLFESNPRVSVVFCDAIYFNDSGPLFSSFKIVNPKRGRVFAEMLRGNFTTSATLVYRKKFLESPPYLYENENFCASEDYEVLLRCAYHHEFDYVDLPLAKRRVGSGDTASCRFLFSREAMIILDRLCQELPGIEDAYEKEISCLKANCQYDFALEAWNEGNVVKAREYLLLHWRSFRCFVGYLCTWIFPSLKAFDLAKGRGNNIRYKLLRLRVKI
ncbi:MAG: glycosyltransferase [Candidatus Saganbacteria bacterium]|nr:glycosyltransferase [Candidatus Saganbacteria bacterium]